jgi:hypothetical protein
MSARLRTICATLLLALGTPAVAAKPHAAAPASCDAKCLHGLADAFLAGLQSRKQGADVPWAPRVRYTENGVGMTVGDGIWATVTAYAKDPLEVVDPAGQSLVWIGAIEEHGQPGWLALRIKADGNRIVEAEAVMRRKQGAPPYGEPADYLRDAAFGRTGAGVPRTRLVGLAQAALPKAPRARNGLILSDIPPGTLRAVSVSAVDTDRGLVALFGRRDHVGSRGDVDGEYPHSYAFVTVFKVDGGRVVAGEEVQSDVMPFLMPAWGQR